MQGFGPPRGPNEPNEGQQRPRLQLPAFHQFGSGVSISSAEAGPNPPPTRLPTFYGLQEYGSFPPNESASRPYEYYGTSQIDTRAPSPNRPPVSTAHNPKRAYRQRRKDPSCDACRERKVKCDATETSSCTECSSRNVRCQFTKDTNRRASSIKQVQDLERQLLEARQQLQQLRAAGQRSDSSELHNLMADQLVSEIPIASQSPRRMPKAKIPQDLGGARMNVAEFGRGLFKPPITSIGTRLQQNESLPLPELPPPDTAEQLLQAYYKSIHRHYPVLHWPELRQNFNLLYESPRNTHLSRETVAIVLAVLACGAQRFRPRDFEGPAHQLLSRSISLIDLWEENTSISRALVIFLASLFLAEANQKSISWIWLGNSIRIAQDLGLNILYGQWEPLEEEMRRRIWWSFYTWDRLLSTELGKPMLINDDECDTEYPEALEDEEDEEEDTTMSSGAFGSENTSTLLASLPVVRLLAPLSKLGRSLCISNEGLGRFESHLEACTNLFPPELQLSSNAPIDPLILAPAIYVQNARILLHRYNLSPSCSAEQRLQAIRLCIAAAQDTAGMISRCLGIQGDDEEQEQNFVSSATSLLCTHLWRCMLFLLIRGDYDSFFALLRVSSLLGETKLINLSCGRNLNFFLQKLIERYKNGTAIDIENDEEIIVYLSADLQGSTNSWVWGNADVGTPISKPQKHEKSAQPTPVDERGSSLERYTSRGSQLSQEEQQQHGDVWETVQQSARHLQNLQQTSPFVTSKPQPASEAPRSPPSTTEESSRSRMKIASII